MNRYIHFHFCDIYIGTPPRLDGKTIQYAFLEKQMGDDPPTPFSFLNLPNGIQVLENA